MSFATIDLLHSIFLTSARIRFLFKLELGAATQAEA